MKTVDLHEEFIQVLYSRLHKKDIVNTVAEVLRLEKDAAYRRLNGKVNFSVREIGIICTELNISLDGLMHKNDQFTWLPFILEHPVNVRSMDELFDVIDACFVQMSLINPQTGETGNIYSSLPMEFYLHSPVLTKFMLFKWGHYFVGTEEFNNYSEWKLPQRANGLFERLQAVYNFNKAYYILDDSLFRSLAKEIHYFHKIHVITTQEKKEIKYAFKDMLTKIEHCLNGTYRPTIEKLQQASFYGCSLPLGFTSNYFMSENMQSIAFHTNFSFCIVDDDKKTFNKLKNWVDSFRNISTLLSHSGRIERRLFFEEQHRLVDYILN